MNQKHAGPSSVGDKRELVAWMEAGCKPSEQWRIGTEHEKFVFRRSDLRPVPHDGPDGIEAFLTGLTDFGWAPVEEAGRVIALRRGNASVTLEPAGQLELSGEPLETLQQSCAEVNGHLREVREVAEPLGVGLLGLGFHPTATRDEMPWMPKARYAIMRAYMPRRGNLGLDMMTRTCGVQVNLDFRSEADMVRKLRVSLALQPVATALFANSPFYEGGVGRFLSGRSQVWTDTDPDRCGMLPFAFESGMGFERYVDYALDVPMYFIARGGRLIDASGQSFRDFMAGRLPALPGERPTLADWEDHLTTLFPEVRLKRFLEMRGADAGPWSRLCALPALWTGLLYDSVALDAAWEIVMSWDAAERERLRQEVPRFGLRTPVGGGTLRDVAVDVVAIAAEGLARRDRNEVEFLDELAEIADSGITPAERLLAKLETDWGGDVTRVFESEAY